MPNCQCKRSISVGKKTALNYSGRENDPQLTFAIWGKGYHRIPGKPSFGGSGKAATRKGIVRTLRVLSVTLIQLSTLIVYEPGNNHRVSFNSATTLLYWRPFLVKQLCASVSFLFSGLHNGVKGVNPSV